MDATPGWALPLLYAGQAQKEMFHNEALARVDMLLHPLVQSADLATPPVAPEIGQCWIVAAGADGAWTGRDGAIACWSEGGWRFAGARAGLQALVIDRGYFMIHDGTDWRDAALREDGLHVGGAKVVGVQGAAILSPAGGSLVDVEARAAIGAVLSALRTHGLIET